MTENLDDPDGESEIRMTGAPTSAYTVKIDRTGGKVSFGEVPYKALLHLNVESFTADECPLCKENVPMTKRGSTGKK